MSTAGDPSENSSMRAGTADRDATAQQLQDAYADGRITSQEHDERLAKCFAAVTMGDLAALTADLPASAPSAPHFAPDPSAPVGSQRPSPPETSREATGRGNGKTLGALWAGWAVLSLFMIAIWAFSGMGSFWPVWVIVPTAFGAAMTTISRMDRNGGR